METNLLVTRLATLTADLQPAGASQASDLANLRKELAAALISQPLEVIRPRVLPTAVSSATLLTAKHLGALTKVATSAIHDTAREAGQAQFSSFERTVPVITNHLEGSVPDWAKGAAVDHTLGPFVGADGIKKWFDFYALTKKQQVKIFTTDVSHPVLVLTVIESVFFPAGQLSYNLPASSVWIAATSLASDFSNMDAYAGLKIKSGQIVFSKAPTLIGNDFQIDNATQITLSVIPDPVSVASADPLVGQDATQAQVNYFSSTVFEFTAGKGKLIEATPAQLTAYGSTVALDTVDPVTGINYITELGGIFIPFQSSTANFDFLSVLSPLWDISGSSKVAEAGWFLPVSLTTASALGEAGGTGELGFIGTHTG